MDEHFEDNMADKVLSATDLINSESLIHDFFEDNNLNLDIPIDIVSLVKKLGFRVLAMDLSLIEENIDGLILVDEVSHRIGQFETDKLIVYDRALKDIKETRFVIAHELAHYIDQKRNGKNVVFGEKIRHGEAKKKEKDKDKIREEQKMDYMAAAILVPRDSLVHELKLIKYNNLDELSKGIVIGDLSNKYAVSSEVMKRRIEEVNS